MNKIAPLFFALSTGFAQASGTINHLEIDNNIVLFSTTEIKTVTSPSCVTAENTSLWSISLSTDAGRAMYSLILTVMAKGDKMGLSIESAQDCNVSDGYERASKVTIVASQITQDAEISPRSYSIGVYQGDGTTRIGTVVGIGSSTWTYIDTEPTRTVKSISFDTPTVRTFYYSEENCQGIMFNNTVGIQYGAGETGMYIPDGDSLGGRAYRSRWHQSSENCTNYSSELIYGNATTLLVPYIDETCGVDICVLKQD